MFWSKGEVSIWNPERLQFRIGKKQAMIWVFAALAALNIHFIGDHFTRLWSGWWFEPLWKILVSWDDYSQYMENKKCSKPPTSITIIFPLLLVYALWKPLLTITINQCMGHHQYMSLILYLSGVSICASESSTAHEFGGITWRWAGPIASCYVVSMACNGNVPLDMNGYVT